MFISMPFALGGDLNILYQKAKRDKINFHERQILWWAKQLIEGVGEIHRNNYIHRDIKMANILISESMRLVICDFGLI